MYFFLPSDPIIDGPHKSICKSSWVSTISESITIWCPCWCFFPYSQTKHNKSLSYLGTGKPRTKSFKRSLLRFLKFKCKILWCQSQPRFEEVFDSKQIEGNPIIGFIFNVNMSLFLLEFNNASFFYFAGDNNSFFFKQQLISSS